ncbi:MAG TPA: cell division protein ZipA C-terminal FtsZ-binding domain-containing protein [Burkholderiales bacterium]|nr:cell division protein ZipA C-terminal FtsZ-binding domain-containing protein [Burkholderiales bacterium]
MSELQIGLLAIGAVVIGAVYAYNRLQERRFQRRMREAFGEAREDALLEGASGAAGAEGRREPRLELSAAPPLREASPIPAAPPATSPGTREAPAWGFDAVLDYVAEVDADEPIPEPALAELLSRLAACGKPVRATGFSPESGSWEEIGRGSAGRYTKLRLALQLVNRAGPVNPAQLAAFCDAVRGCAERAAARALCPDAQPALKTARELDAFCTEVDVAIGVNVVAADGAVFAATRIRALAESAGFKLEHDGVFHYRDEHRQTLFTLDNHEPAPFLPEQVKNLTTRGVTLMLDVPRVADGARALARMLEIARGLAASLGGRLVDDNRVPLTEAGVARIEQQLRSIQAAMAARGIPAGSARALRLFS